VTSVNVGLSSGVDGSVRLVVVPQDSGLGVRLDNTPDAGRLARTSVDTL